MELTAAFYLIQVFTETEAVYNFLSVSHEGQMYGLYLKPRKHLFTSVTNQTKQETS